MSKNLESRIERLERHTSNSQVFIMTYHSDIQTREEAEAEFEKEHGFKLPDNALVINYCRIDPNSSGETS